MKRVGFIPDPTPLAPIPMNPGASQENELLADAVDDNTEPDAEPDNEPAAVPDADPDKKPAGRKPRRKADEG